jgi:hypothetical protein
MLYLLIKSMGCKSSKPKIIDTNDLIYFNIINMCNSLHLNVKTIDDVKVYAERFKVVEFENMIVIIITIKPNNMISFITTVWVANCSNNYEYIDCFNLCSKKYNYTYKELDKYLNDIINQYNFQTS